MTTNLGEPVRLLNMAALPSKPLLPLDIENSVTCGATPISPLISCLSDVDFQCYFTRYLCSCRLPTASKLHQDHSFLSGRLLQLYLSLAVPSDFLHTLGVSGFKVRCQGIKGHLCLTSIPPGNCTRLPWLMFQETPGDRALDSHGYIKGESKGAKLVGWLQPSQGWKEAELHLLYKYFHSAWVTGSGAGNSGLWNNLANGKLKGFFRSHACVHALNTVCFHISREGTPSCPRTWLEGRMEPCPCWAGQLAGAEERGTWWGKEIAQLSREGGTRPFEKKANR